MRRILTGCLFALLPMWVVFHGDQAGAAVRKVEQVISQVTCTPVGRDLRPALRCATKVIVLEAKLWRR